MRLKEADADTLLEKEHGFVVLSENVKREKSEGSVDTNKDLPRDLLAV